MTGSSGFRELHSVEDTALDAANAKASAVSRGYYTDPYIDYFVPNRVRQIPPMNLGYFVRSLCMWQALIRYHRIYKKEMQVVSLGGGYDTLFWRLRDRGVAVSLWFDIDLPHVVKRKLDVVTTNSVFEPLTEYRCLALDVAVAGECEKGLVENGFDPKAPTLFIDECALIYVEPAAVDALIRFAGGLPRAAFISYGMICPDDGFGTTMVRNFEGIGAPLKGIHEYPTADAHRLRFERGGFRYAKAVDMVAAMRAVLPGEDLAKVRRVELQDDPEELDFMLAHYVLAMAATAEDGGFMALLP